jgi:hypothetical protein
MTGPSPVMTSISRNTSASPIVANIGSREKISRDEKPELSAALCRWARTGAGGASGEWGRS